MESKIKLSSITSGKNINPNIMVDKTMNNLNRILEELKREIRGYYSSTHGLPPLSYKQILKSGYGDDYELIVEVKPYKKEVGIPIIIRNYIKQNDLTVKDLAERIRIGRPQLQNFLNGKVSLSFSLADKFGSLLGIDPLTLLKIDAEVRYKFSKNKKIFLENLSAVEGLSEQDFPVNHLKQPPSKR